MESSIVSLGEIVVIVILISLSFLTVTSSWIIADYYYYLTIFLLTIVSVLMSISIYGLHQNPYGAIVAASSVYLFFLYIFTYKYLLGEKLFVVGSYGAIKDKLLKKCGEKVGARITAELPILSAVLFVLGIFFHNILN